MYEYAVRVLRVLDGDTVEVSISLGFHISLQQTLRLAGINTPETNARDPAERAAGSRAKQYVAHALRVGTITDASLPALEGVKVRSAKPYASDKFGRWLGTILFRHAGDPADAWRDLNAELVAGGFARPYDGGAR